MCGLSVAESWVSKTLPRTFISKRFDRSWSDGIRMIDGLPIPFRLHQEDYCQALGWEDYSKYEVDPTSCYARICGELIRRTSFDALSDVRSFARQVAFDYVIGNCDSHLKNHSFLYSPSWSARRLAPAYDIVSTTVLGYDHNLGMSIGDHRRIEEVCPEDLSLFVGDVHATRRLFSKTAAASSRSFQMPLGNSGIRMSSLVKWPLPFSMTFSRGYWFFRHFARGGGVGGARAMLVFSEEVAPLESAA